MEKIKHNRPLMVLVLAAVIIIIPVLTPNMYIMQIINMICIYIILGTSINVLTGFTGQLSLGQAAFFCVLHAILLIIIDVNGAKPLHPRL